MQSIERGVEAATGAGQPTQLLGSTGIITVIVGDLLFIVGALSVIMIIIGGVRYVVSGGNASAVTAAKNTVMYALIGLVIAVLAYAIVSFVFKAVTTGNVGFTTT